jgi:hypothetical protein
MVAEKKKEVEVKKAGRGRPPKKTTLSTVEEILPISQVEEIYNSQLINQDKTVKLSLETNGKNLTNSDLVTIQDDIQANILNLNKRELSYKNMLFDLSTKNRGVKNKLNLLEINIENVKRTIRSAQNKLSILHGKCDNLPISDITSRSVILRFFLNLVGRKDRLNLKSSIAYLQEKITMHNLTLQKLYRLEAQELLTFKSANKVIRSIEESYDSTLVTRQQLQTTSTRISEELTSLEINESREILFKDYQTSIQQLQEQSVHEEEFLLDIVSDRTKVQKFLDAVQDEASGNKDLQKIMNDLDLDLRF